MRYSFRQLHPRISTAGQNNHTEMSSHLCHCVTQVYRPDTPHLKGVKEQMGSTSQFSQLKAPSTAPYPTAQKIARASPTSPSHMYATGSGPVTQHPHLLVVRAYALSAYPYIHLYLQKKYFHFHNYLQTDVFCFIT